MDSVHDLGGRQGFGPVLAEENEPVFHHRWEACVFTIANHMIGQGVIRNVDQFRHAIERIDPVAYLTHTYYGRWLGGVENLLTEAGVVDPEAMAAAVEARGGDRNDPVAARPGKRPDPVAAADAPGARRALSAAPRFAEGELVRTTATPVSGHTRLPAYARGRIGKVLRHQGGWVYPDTNAHGRGEQPQHLYCVQFDGEALWGPEAEPGQSVCLDLFEPYLTPVEV